MSYKLELRKNVYSLVGKMPKRQIVQLFADENISRTTIYRTIRECEEGIPCQNLLKSGRPRQLAAARIQERLLHFAENRVGASSRKLARRFHVSHTTILREMKRNQSKYRKRQKCPKYTQDQLRRIRQCCRFLRDIHFARNRIIVIDDEKYFPLSMAEIPGNAGFYTRNVDETPDEVKYKTKTKFPEKVLVWCAISEAGVSRPYIGRVRGEAVTANLYCERCLPKLVDFINLHHPDDEIIFWPDLASSHYARVTTQWLEEHNIPFVPRAHNPPNVPQARPIETFWALLTQKVYENGWEAQTGDQLRNRIRTKLGEINPESCQRLMGGVRAKLRQIEQFGPLSII